jgi:hypothetical protein
MKSDFTVLLWCPVWAYLIYEMLLISGCSYLCSILSYVSPSLLEAHAANALVLVFVMKAFFMFV